MEDPEPTRDFKHPSGITLEERQNEQILVVVHMEVLQTVCKMHIALGEEGLKL